MLLEPPVRYDEEKVARELRSASRSLFFSCRSFSEEAFFISYIQCRNLSRVRVESLFRFEIVRGFACARVFPDVIWRAKNDFGSQCVFEATTVMYSYGNTPNIWDSWFSGKCNHKLGIKHKKFNLGITGILIFII